jgi:hypothetical protein
MAQKNFLKEKHKDSILNLGNSSSSKFKCRLNHYCLPLDVASVLSSESKQSMVSEYGGVSFNKGNSQSKKSITPLSSCQNSKKSDFLPDKSFGQGGVHCPQAKLESNQDNTAEFFSDMEKVNTKSSNTSRRAGQGHHRYKSCIDLESSDLLVSTKVCSIFSY